MVEFLIDPVSKPRMTRSDSWRHRKCVDDYYSFKDKLVLLAKKSKFVLPDKFRIEFLIKVPDSWSEKKKLSMIGKPHQQKFDLDNLIKAVMDCLRKSDASIYHIEMSKTWWERGKIIIYDIK
jgi:Holliday junction resolvase RusA-like endonuclease